MVWLSLAGALLVLTVGAEALVRGASALALKLGVSPLFVGLTVVGIGTSSPELAASLLATLEGSAGISVGNAVGSNLFNIGVILGLTAVVAPIRIALGALRRDLAVAFAAATLPFVALFGGGYVGPLAGGVFVALLAAYLWSAFRAGRRGGDQAERADEEVRSSLAIAETARLRDRTWFHLTTVALGLAALVVGSRWFVQEALELAAAAGVPERVVGLTIVSAGTSMPELVTSIVAARRGNPDVAVGNVVGSNVFNILGVLGVCALVRPQAVSTAALTVDLPLLLVATACLYPMLRTGGRISRLEGLLLLSGYGTYLAVLLAAGA